MNCPDFVPDDLGEPREVPRVTVDALLDDARRTAYPISRKITIRERVLNRMIARLEWWAEGISESQWRKAGQDDIASREPIGMHRFYRG